MNYFKFHSVGQGLFYTGALAHKTFNFVYDCGTESKQHYLHSSIDSYIREIQGDKSNKPQIDFVVISHLHKDHFSGLLNLATKISIRRVYLPYLGHDKNFISLILAYAIFHNEETVENEENLYNLFYFMCGLYGIQENYDFPRIEAVFLGENAEEDLNHDFFCSTQEEYVHIGAEKYWKFVFINRGICKKELISLNNKVLEILDTLKVESIIELISLNKGIQKIVKIYNEVFYSQIINDRNFLNMTSIVLVHFPLYSSPKAFYADSNEVMELSSRKVESRYFAYYYPYDYFCLNFEKIMNPLTILSGDLMVDNTMKKLILSQLNSTNSSLKSSCGVLQVPHHGSKNNWNAWSNISINSQLYVISFGLGNRHKHPHPDTIDDIILSKKQPYLVNQIQDFEYYID